MPVGLVRVRSMFFETAALVFQETLKALIFSVSAVDGPKS